MKLRRPIIKKLKWGVAGLGRYAEFTFIPTLSLLRKSSLHSLFSNNAERAQSIADKFGVTDHFSNFDEFLKSDIDAVYISSANFHHYDQVIKAAKAGKHVLCEKPIAMDSKQAEDMVKTCEQNNVKFAVNYSLRFHPIITKAKELLDSQILGKLVSIGVNYNVDFPPGPNFRFQKEQSGGGALRDIGTHMIDLLRFFGGEVTSINGVYDNIIYKSEVDDFGMGMVKFEESGYGSFNVSYNNIKSFNRIEILGHKGALGIENLIGVKNSPAKLIILLEGEAKKSFRKRGNKFFYLLKSVQNSFLINQKPLVTGEDGWINLKLMEQLEGKCRTQMQL
jgi:xylose dehydrogenase (NAD/NADP)